MILTREDADVVIALLNEALELDPEAMTKLFTHRVPCNAALGNHWAIQVRGLPDGGMDVGFVGLLNGIFGAGQVDGYGRIAGVWEGEKLLRFEHHDPEQPRGGPLNVPAPVLRAIAVAEGKELVQEHVTQLLAVLKHPELTTNEHAVVDELRRVRVPHVEQLIAIIDRLAPPPPRVIEPAGLDFYEEAQLAEMADSVREVVERYGGRYIETAESATIWIGDEKRREHFDESPPRIARRLLLQWLRERQTGRAGP